MTFNHFVILLRLDLFAPAQIYAIGQTDIYFRSFPTIISLLLLRTQPPSAVFRLIEISRSRTYPPIELRNNPLRIRSPRKDARVRYGNGCSGLHMSSLGQDEEQVDA